MTEASADCTLVAVLLAAALAWSPIVTVPTAPGPSVEWIAPQGCPSEENVHERIDALLAEGGSGRREPVSLRLEVTGKPGAFTLTATSTDTAGPLGERVVSGQRCEDIAGAAVLIAAIAIDPELTPPEPEPTALVPTALVPPEPVPSEPVPPEPEPAEPEPMPDEPMPDEPVPAEPAPSAPPPKRRVPLVPLATADVGLGFGRLASATPMVLGRVGGGFERNRLRMLIRLTGAGPSFGSAEDGPAGGRFGLAAVGIAGCARSLGQRWQVIGCLGSDVGFVAGEGRGTIAHTNRALSAWWGIEAELGLEYLIRPRWALALRADGGGVPATPNLVIDDQGRVCCVQWSAGLRLGVTGRFGGPK